MIKLSNQLLELDNDMRFFAKAAHTRLLEILYSNNKIPLKRKRRKIDQKLDELLTYLEKIDQLGFQMKLEICIKKEVMDQANKKIRDKERKKKRR